MGNLLPRARGIAPTIGTPSGAVRPRSATTGILLLLLLTTAAAEFSCSSAGPFRKQLVFEREQLQKKVAAKFPLKKKESLASVTFSNPSVLLAAGAERLGIGMDVKISMLGGKKITGSVEVDGDLQYDPKRGEFAVVDARVKQLDLDQVAAKKASKLEAVVDEVAKRYLSNIPVFTLDQGDFKQSLAKLLLKSVEVEDGRVVVVVGL